MAQDEPQPQSGKATDKQPTVKAAVKELKGNNKVKQKEPKQGKPVSDEVKAQIVACLLSGQFNRDEDIAKEVNVSTMTVSRMKRAIPPEMLLEVVNQKKDRIGELITQMLESGLESLNRISEQTKNTIWMDQQSAAELATLYGVKADKIIKILEAIERANAEGAKGEGDSPVSAVSQG